MFLRELEVANYRSLENVKLDHLDKFNVLIGRNNAGKSSVFGAIQLLHSVVNGIGQVDWPSVLTDKEARPLKIRLLFELQENEREEWIDLILTTDPWKPRKPIML